MRDPAPNKDGRQLKNDTLGVSHQVFLCARACALPCLRVQEHTHSHTDVYTCIHPKINSILRLRGCPSSVPHPRFLLRSSALNGYHGKTAPTPAVPRARIRNCCSLSQYIRKSNTDLVQTDTGTAQRKCPSDTERERLHPAACVSRRCHTPALS